MRRPRPSGDTILRERGIMVLPDILANRYRMRLELRVTETEGDPLWPASPAPPRRRTPTRNVYAPLSATTAREAAMSPLPPRHENGSPRQRVPGASAHDPIVVPIQGGHFHGTVRRTVSLDSDIAGLRFSA